MVTFSKPDNGSFLATMKELFDRSEFTDIKLNVEGTIFAVHKPILYHYSPMLKGMLTDETRDEYEETIVLKDVELKYFKEILKYMYTGQFEVEQDNIIGLLKTADYFQIEDLKRFCLSTLQTFLATENAIEYFLTGRLYNDDKLMNSSAELIWNNLSTVQNELNSCPFDDFKRLLKTRTNATDEYETYTCVKQWITFEIGRNKCFNELMELFDFDKMSPANLRLLVADDLMKQHPEQRELVIEISLRKASEMSQECV